MINATSNNHPLASILPVLSDMTILQNFACKTLHQHGSQS
jgi:hypothetical protein